MIALLVLALSLVIVAANVAVVALFVVRRERAGQPTADRHDHALQDAG